MFLSKEENAYEWLYFPANLRNSRCIAIMREILCVSECMDVDVVCFCPGSNVVPIVAIPKATLLIA